MNIFVSTWALLVGGLIFALPMIHLRVKDHTDIKDETMYVYSRYPRQLTLTTFVSRARMDDTGKVLPAEAVAEKQ
jgi:hypothetical protein